MIVATAVVAPVAYMAMFSGFFATDDEGYFLVLFRDYLGGQPLLGPATPIYGPFFFETLAAFFKILGLAPGQDTGRLLTLAVWLLTDVLAALTTYRLTRNLWLSLGAELLTVHVLMDLTHEPMSPQALISLLLVLLATTATFRSTRPRLTAALVGGIVAALCLTKINVGFFAAYAVVLAWSAGLSGAWRRVVLPAAAVGGVVLPFALTSSLLTQAWVAEFAIGMALSSAALGVVLLTIGPRPAQPQGAAVWVLTGGALVIVVCVLIAIAGGTSLADLWNGLIVYSFRQPHIFTIPIDVSPLFDVIAAGSLAASILLARARSTTLLSPAIRASVGLSIWAAMFLVPTAIFLVTLPAAWVAAVRPGGEPGDHAMDYARVLLPGLAIANTLQAYPVSGTQASLAAFMQVFLGAICLADAAREVRRLSSGRSASRAPAAGAALGILAFGLNAAFTPGAYNHQVPLGLPAAMSVRVSAAQATQLRALVSAIDGQCSDLITFPGMNSFYVWTDQTPPPGLRSEVWMATYTDAQQQSVLDQISGANRLCVVKNDRVIRFWMGARSPHGPLVSFIDQNFVPIGTYGDYQLLTQSGKNG
ncbi:MAG TPA: hypothetical protein VGT01_03175 [Candidatus Dormibacteraeota bacterium]|nr:hypothetical protein [Candidatus Dormibacteraeota bacterium]